MSANTIKLSEPLKTHGGEVLELVLKAPRARLFVKYGDAFRIVPRKSATGEIENYEYEFNNDATLKYAAEMTGVDDIILSELPAADFMKLRGAIANVIMGIVPDKNPSEQPVA